METGSDFDIANWSEGEQIQEGQRHTDLLHHGLQQQRPDTSVHTANCHFSFFSYHYIYCSFSALNMQHARRAIAASLQLTRSDTNGKHNYGNYNSSVWPTATTSSWIPMRYPPMVCPRPTAGAHPRCRGVAPDCRTEGWLRLPRTPPMCGKVTCGVEYYSESMLEMRWGDSHSHAAVFSVQEARQGDLTQRSSRRHETGTNSIHSHSTSTTTTQLHIRLCCLTCSACVFSLYVHFVSFHSRASAARQARPTSSALSNDTIIDHKPKLIHITLDVACCACFIYLFIFCICVLFLFIIARLARRP